MTSPWRGRVLATWVDAARRHSGWIVAAAVLFTALGAGYAARHLGVQTDTRAIFDPDLEFRRLETELLEAFPMLEDAVVVVLDAPSTSRAEQAAEALVAHLEARPGLYGEVHAPGVGPFFRRHGLLYRDVEDLEVLVDRLAAAQPFLTELARDPSLRGLGRLIERALARADQAEARGMHLGDALAEVEASVREAAEQRVRPLAFGALLVRGEDEEGAARRYVLVQLRADYSELVPATAAIEQLRSSFGELGFDGSGVRARFTGNLALSQEELAITRRQAGLAGAVSFVLVTGLLFGALRSARLVLAAAITLAAGLVWTGAFAAAAVGHLNMISVAFGVVFIGLGVDFGIHFGLRYRELRSHGTSHAEALRETGSGVGGSLVLCAITTATGFFAFVPTGYRGVSELGVIAGVGMFVSLFAALTLLPALLSVGGEPRFASKGDATGSGSHPAMRHPGVLLAVTAVLAGLGAILAPRLEFDANPLRVRDPSAETVQTFAELVREGDLNPWTAEVLAGSLAEAEALSVDLAALPEVDRSVSLLDYVPEDQPEKLALLGDARLLLNLTPPAARRAAPDADQERAALASLRQALQEFVVSGESSSLRDSAGRVAAALGAFEGPGPEPAARLERLRSALVAPIRSGLGDIETALSAGQVKLADLPEPLRRRMLAADGRARLQVFPVGDLNDTAAHEAFVAAVRNVAPRASGDAVGILESERTVVRALIQAFSGAGLVITLALLALWRSPRDAALVLAPIAVATLVLLGVLVLADMPLNFANVIVLPLLLGIGVDSGIHMVHRHRAGEAAHLLETSTPRAISWSALTTIASFGSLAFATHRGMASLGQLLVLGVALTLAANLLVLPALLALVDRRRRALRRPTV